MEELASANQLSHISVQSTARLACPYFKRSPLNHPNSACTGPGFSGVQRLKDHLKKRHKLPLHCDRCWTIFSDEEGYKAHRMLPPEQICHAGTGFPLEGINEKQYSQLHDRSNFKGAKTEEDKWRRIYSILFPHDAQIPTPYYEYASRQSSDPHSTAEYHEYLQKEFPNLLMRELSEDKTTELGQLDLSTNAWLPNVVRRSLQCAFQAYTNKTNSVLFESQQSCATNENIAQQTSTRFNFGDIIDENLLNGSGTMEWDDFGSDSVVQDAD